MSSGKAARWSLRARLTRNVLGLVAVGWILAILVTAVLVQREVNEALDGQLKALGDATVLMLDDTGVEPFPRAASVTGDGDTRMIRIIPEGAVPPAAPWEIPPEDGFHDSNGWRVLRLTTQRTVLELADNARWRAEEVAESTVGLLVLLVPLAGLVLLTVRLAVNATTQPVRAFAGRVARRGSDDFDPIEVGNLPDELRPVVESLNGYIRRVAALREAERAFIANAAHELRTPIAALRAQLETEDSAAAGRLLPTLDRLARRIERLLQLSRSEAGAVLGKGPSDLMRILRLVLDERPKADRALIRVDDGDVESLPVRVDADALAILLRNVIDNAVEHGGGEVRIRLEDGPVLCIENGVPEGAAFAEGRFESAGPRGGIGLGLAIVDTVAAATGIAVSRRIDKGVARVRLDLGSVVG